MCYGYGLCLRLLVHVHFFLRRAFQVDVVPFFMFRISCLCGNLMFYVYADAHRYEYALRLCLRILYAYLWFL